MANTMQWMQQAVSKLVGQYSSGPLQQKSMLSKEQLTKFFTASTDLLETEAVKKELKTAADQGQDPEEIITDLQKELFKAQGIDGVFGIEEEEAVNEAELSPEEFQIRKERMKAMREQNDALVAQMEGMSHEEQQHFLAAQVQERLDQLAPEEREEALQALMGHQCGDSCSHDHHAHHEEPHVDGPNCAHEGDHASRGHSTVQETDEASASPSDAHHM
ncbi:TPA: hypothetical protein ACH3X2_012539 [Trebouxia sp. C0005]